MGHAKTKQKMFFSSVNNNYTNYKRHTVYTPPSEFVAVIIENCEVKHKCAHTDHDLTTKTDAVNSGMVGETMVPGENYLPSRNEMADFFILYVLF